MSSQYTSILGIYGTEKIIEDKGKTASQVDSLHAQRKIRRESSQCGEKVCSRPSLSKKIQFHVFDELFDAYIFQMKIPPWLAHTTLNNLKTAQTTEP